MKIKKIIAIVAGLTIAASTFVGTTTVSATTAEDVTNGIVLEYDKDASTATTRAINVYKKGKPEILGAFTVQLQFMTVGDLETKCADVSGATLENEVKGIRDTANTYKVQYLKTSKKATLQYLPEAGSGGYDGGDFLGTIVVTVTDENTTFVPVALKAEVASDDGTYNSSLDPQGDQTLSQINDIVVPAYTTGGGSTEVPAGEGQTFVDYKDPHVKVFTANLGETDYSGKTISWVLTRTSDGKLSKPIAAKTDFSGGLDVTLGLKIVGDISDIASAKLVIE